MSDQEQPDDQTPVDQTPVDQTGGDDTAEPETEDAGEGGAEPTEDERLEQLDERIDKARTRAEDAGVLVDTGEDEDQTIAPPG